MNIQYIKMVAFALFFSAVTLQSGCKFDPHGMEFVEPILSSEDSDQAIAPYEDWLKYNHFLKQASNTRRKKEIKKISIKLKRDNVPHNQLKYIVATTHVDAALDELIQAKAFLNRLMKKRIIPDTERMFWELYSDNLNDAIRFKKLTILVNKKYQEEKKARTILEGKIKELSEIEQETEDRIKESNRN